LDNNNNNNHKNRQKNLIEAKAKAERADVTREAATSHLRRVDNHKSMKMVKDSIRWRKPNRRTSTALEPPMFPRGLAVSGDEEDFLEEDTGGGGGGGGGGGRRRHSAEKVDEGSSRSVLLLGRDPDKLPITTRQAMSLRQCWRTYGCVRVVATVAIVCSTLSLQLMQSALVSMASLLCIGTATILFLQQRILRKLTPLRRQHNELRKIVHYLRQERERLHRGLERIDESIVELQHVPKQLNQLVRGEQRLDVDRIVRVIQEQDELQERIRNKINQQVLQSIVSIVVRSDRDGNWTLKPTEIESLIVRLGLVEGVVFHEKRFRQLFQADSPPTISTVMKVIRSLLERDDEYQHPPSIFEFKRMTSR
jgi:hypothetical protein